MIRCDICGNRSRRYRDYGDALACEDCSRGDAHLPLWHVDHQAGELVSEQAFLGYPPAIFGGAA